MSDTLGFIGLGKLGLPMATHLIEAGHALRVYNRTASKADSLLALGAARVATPADAATPGGIVLSVLWDDASVEAMVNSAGFLERLGEGGVHVSMSTISPEAARRLAALHAAHGSHYVEAPVFGRPEAAVARKLWMPIAGAQGAKARVRPLLETMGAQGVFDLGEAIGAAVITKLIGNFMIISAARTMSEGLTFADKSGVDMKPVIEMLTTTLFNAPIYQSYGKMIAGRSAPMMQSPIPLKDIGIFMAAAALVHAPTPIAARLGELLQQQPPHGT